jgi:hypothetical protein
MIDPYSPLEKSMREYTKDAAKIRAEAYADAVAREAREARAELRDRFAGYALIGLLQAGGDLADCGRDEIAREAWRQAEAMMEEREKRSQVDMKARDHD